MGVFLRFIVNHLMFPVFDSCGGDRLVPRSKVIGGTGAGDCRRISNLGIVIMTPGSSEAPNPTPLPEVISLLPTETPFQLLIPGHTCTKFWATDTASLNEAIVGCF